MPNSMSLKTVAVVVMLATISHAADPNQPQQKAFLDAKAILDGWESNYGSINSMKVKYLENLVASNFNKTDSTIIVFQNVYRIEQGKCFHAYSSGNKRGLSDPWSVWEYSFDGDIATGYAWAENDMGSRPGVKHIPNRLRECMLMEMETTGKSIDRIPAFNKIMEKGISHSTVKVYPYLETAAGQLCHRLDIAEGNDPEIISMRIWVAHEKGMLPVKWKRSFHGDRNEIQMLQIDSVRMGEQTIWYPRKACRFTSPDLQYKITIELFIPNPEIKEEDLHIQYPVTAAIVEKVCGISEPAKAEQIAELLRKGNPPINDPNQQQETSTQQPVPAPDPQSKACPEQSERIGNPKLVPAPERGSKIESPNSLPARQKN